MDLPLHLFEYLNSITIFGMILLLGLLGGEITKKIPYLPKITGYMLVGLLLGPRVLNLLNEPLLHNTQIFITISLGIILYELGKCLDFEWLKNDISILYMSVADITITFLLIG